MDALRHHHSVLIVHDHQLVALSVVLEVQVHHKEVQDHQLVVHTALVLQASHLVQPVAHQEHLAVLLAQELVSLHLVHEVILAQHRLIQVHAHHQVAHLLTQHAHPLAEFSVGGVQMVEAQVSAVEVLQVGTEAVEDLIVAEIPPAVAERAEVKESTHQNS